MGQDADIGSRERAVEIAGQVDGYLFCVEKVTGGVGHVPSFSVDT
jgi:hypothetical protein